mmetsp:Transcript_45512/g.120208  ORF Transcript_45512/g.120208 Transcript_45512/m.120208 type:complete len:288 (-) Transcript_45512:67-930(-)
MHPANGALVALQPQHARAVIAQAHVPAGKDRGRSRPRQAYHTLRSVRSHQGGGGLFVRLATVNLPDLVYVFNVGHVQALHNWLDNPAPSLKLHSSTSDLHNLLLGRVLGASQLDHDGVYIGTIVRFVLHFLHPQRDQVQQKIVRSCERRRPERKSHWLRSARRLQDRLPLRIPASLRGRKLPHQIRNCDLTRDLSIHQALQGKYIDSALLADQLQGPLPEIQGVRDQHRLGDVRPLVLPRPCGQAHCAPQISGPSWLRRGCRGLIILPLAQYKNLLRSIGDGSLGLP